MKVSARSIDGSSHEAIEREVQRVIRRWAWAAACAAVLIGLFFIAFPRRTLEAVALVAGVYFIVAGIGRVATAFGSQRPVVSRVAVGCLGVAVVIVGALCLNNPLRTVAALDLLIGIGLIVDGVACFVIASLSTERSTRRTIVITALISTLSGGVVLVTQSSTLNAILLVAAICFMVLGVVTILALISSDQKKP